MIPILNGCGELSASAITLRKFGTLVPLDFAQVPRNLSAFKISGHKETQTGVLMKTKNVSVNMHIDVQVGTNWECLEKCDQPVTCETCGEIAFSAKDGCDCPPVGLIKRVLADARG